MNKLLKEIQQLKQTEVKQLIGKRMQEFKALGRKRNNELFKELCFCILTANCAAQACILVQKGMGNDFLDLSEKQLAQKLKSLGYRFPNKRAHYIFEARKHKNCLKEKIRSFKSEFDLRNWLSENVKGLGLKESSHFLRNIGFKNSAILDFHILDLLEKNRLIKKPKTLSKKNYLQIEKLLEKIASSAKMNLSELDLYLWFLETGKVLK